MALPNVGVSVALAALAAGVVVARLDAKVAYAPLGLSAGKNYLWVDSRGPRANPWRGIMISADGKKRTLLTNFKYTPDSAHAKGGSSLEHARLYCNGQQLCLFFDSKGSEGE
jgi:hypothetical protein